MPTWPIALGARRRHGRALTAGRVDGIVLSTWRLAYPRRGAAQGDCANVQGRWPAGRFSFYNPGFLSPNAFHWITPSANMTRFGGDSDDAADMTVAELSVRRDVWELVRYPASHRARLRELLRAADLTRRSARARAARSLAPTR